MTIDDTGASGTASVGGASVGGVPAGAAWVGAASVGTARRSQLRRHSELARTAVATIELLRADGGGVARAGGWWSPAGLLLHRTQPGRSATYVRAPAGQLGPSVLRALRAGGLGPVTANVAVSSVREVLAVARGAHRPWLDGFGACRPGEVALLRWEVRLRDRRALAVRALLTGPAGAAILRDRGRDGVVLVPTDAVAEHAVLAQVRDVLVARCHLDVAAAARDAAAQLTRSATSTPSRIGASELT